MSVTSIYLDADMSDDDRRARLYAGDIFIYSPTPASRALADLGRAMLEECFAPHDPRTIHEHSAPEAVAEKLAKLKPAFIHHPECKQIIPRLMAEHGVDLEKLYFDVPRMRSAYPSHFLSSGIAYAFHPHRDTWYSAPQCQLNWWLPIYPLDRNNGMGFYPRHFEEPVANNSEIYNYYEWNTKNRASAAQHVRSDTREQPKASQEIDTTTLRYLPPPGGIILFSGAQLHESVKNTTGVARYSIDFRTVHLDDVRTMAGAPNIDSRCTGTTMRDYLRATDLSHLPDEAIAPYDDGSGEGKTLYFGDRLVSESN
ncbi:MAG: hypothetical protein R3C25_08670 [Hyphomonadaceae bacterium]